jgi:hypothetical protein
MNIAEYIQLALALLQVSLTAAKVNGLPVEVIADLEAAVTKLQSVQGTPVSWEQLNGLRVTPTW